jgi:hypothetical protein
VKGKHRTRNSVVAIPFAPEPFSLVLEISRILAATAVPIPLRPAYSSRMR